MAKGDAEEAKPKTTIGAAIDQVLSALESFDDRSQRTILTTVCSVLGIKLEALVPPASPPAAAPVTPHQLRPVDTPPVAPSAHAPKHARPDIRSLKDEKQPKTAIQMACVVAYFLTELAQGEEKKESINSDDIEKYFKQAGYKLPSRVTQLLIDTKAAGYFDSAGKAQYKLNSVGYNLVAHSMPIIPAK